MKQERVACAYRGWAGRILLPCQRCQARAATAVALALLGVSAWAQVGPPAVDPGRLHQRFELPAPSEAGRPLPAFKAGLHDTVPESMRALRVTLHSIVVEGATVFMPDDLLPLTAPSLGREVSGSDIFALAQALTAHYRNAGYFLTLVVVPPQSLADHTLTLRVIEGYVNQVHVEGDPSQRDRMLAIGARIRASRPLQAQVLEHYLLLANEPPGVELRSVLSPAQTVGAADLTLIAGRVRGGTGASSGSASLPGGIKRVVQRPLASAAAVLEQGGSVEINLSPEPECEGQ